MVSNPLFTKMSRGSARAPLGILLRGASVGGALILASAYAVGQDAPSEPGPARAVSIVPRVSVTETFTDNVRLVSAGRQSDQITELSPGVRISRDAGRLKGVFDYALNRVEYAQNASLSRSQTALNTFGTLEAVENWMYLDFSGAIAQQSISAFGTLSNDNAASNTNKTEVSNYRVSPYLRGRLGDVANYEARYGRSVTRGDAASVSGVATSDTLVNFNGDSAFRSLGWSVDANRQSIDYSAGRPTEADRFDLGLSYSVTPQLSVTASAGREFSNYTSLDKQAYATNSYGVNWAPSETSKFSALQGNRSFGESHSLSFEHRTPRTVWRFTDTKDVSATPNQTGVASLGTTYDLFFRQFASLIPNPISRAQFVNAFLQANGISPTAPVTTSFLTSSVSLLRRQDLSFAVLGIRDTVTVIATQSESSRLDTVSTSFDDFTTGSAVRQHGLSVNYSHRFTPEYSLGVLVSQQVTSGGANLQDATLNFLNISLTGRVRNNATASLGVRRSVSSGSSPYEENAVVFNFIVQF
jgi:uncharacterized protein (PEP-CTERM system associated)